MDGHLPDEILKEILTPVLKVSDTAFRDISPRSPFFAYSESPSAQLLVCKSWLRVATPLLYNVVVLRSRAQAQALERTLRGNELLGTFIKKLRVEGGFGVSMRHIIQRAPNITDIWLTLCLWSSDSVSGLCRGLPTMDPQRVILCDSSARRKNYNACIGKLVNTLDECLRSWKNMETLSLPWDSTQFWGEKWRYQQIASAMNEAPGLKTLILKHPQCSEAILRDLTQNKSLELVRIVLQPSESIRDDKLAMDYTKALERHLQLAVPHRKFTVPVRFEYPESDSEITPLDPTAAPSANFNTSFATLHSSSDAVKETIYSRVILYTLLKDDWEVARHSNDVPASTWMPGPSIEYTNKTIRQNVALVSRLFYKLCLQHLYEYYVITSNAQLKNLARNLEHDPPMGAYIRSLVFDPEQGFDGYATAVALRTILSHTPNLVYLCCRRNPITRHYTSINHAEEPRIDFEGLRALADVAGSTLRAFSGLVYDARHVYPIEELYKFTALQSLDLTDSVTVKFDEPSEVPIPSSALPNLEYFRHAGNSGAVLRVFQCMELPRIKNLAFGLLREQEGSYEFLVQHGKKLKFLTTGFPERCFDLCPALSSLHIIDTLQPPFKPHANLTDLILSKTYHDLHTKSKCDFDKWKRSLKADLNYLYDIKFRELYPALREIQVYQCHWPTTEHELKRLNGLWVKWSERLILWDIKLTDQEGRRWRPRLK